MNPAEMKSRTKAFAFRIVGIAVSLPQGRISNVIGKQLLRAGTSVDENYRSACRARSCSDFINRMSIVEQETDESIYWMELLAESSLIPENKLDLLMKEAEEILETTVASINTTRQRSKVVQISNLKGAFQSEIRNPQLYECN